MITRIGVIAEDVSDIDVLSELVGKITNHTYVIRKFVGYGCGKIKRECNRWARNLKEQNCSVLILMHDLDERDLPELKKELVDALYPSPIRNNIIAIPVKEIEAWLLSDEDAIRQGMNLRSKVSRIPNPEGIHRPKEHLGRLVEQRSGGTKHYLNTVHNRRIASALTVEKVRRCKSFLPLEQFIMKNI